MKSCVYVFFFFFYLLVTIFPAKIVDSPLYVYRRQLGFFIAEASPIRKFRRAIATLWYARWHSASVSRARFLPLKIDSFGHLNAAFGRRGGSARDRNNFFLALSTFNIDRRILSSRRHRHPDVLRNRCQINRIERQDVKLRTEQRSWKHRCSVATESDLRLKRTTNVLFYGREIRVRKCLVFKSDFFFFSSIASWRCIRSNSLLIPGAVKMRK